MSMTEQQYAELQLTYIRGTIAGQTPEYRAAVEVAAQELRDLIKRQGDHGFMALALVGAEFAATAPGA